MFGFSLAELIIVFLVAIIFIKPQDLPEIAHFLGRLYYKARKLFEELKIQLKTAQKELGLDEIKQEIDRGIAEEKIKSSSENKTTKIIDIYGNSHEVNATSIRGDLTKEELTAEIKKYNDINASTKLEP